MNCIRTAVVAGVIFIGTAASDSFAATNSVPNMAKKTAVQPRQIMRSGYNSITRMVDAVVTDDGPLVHTAQIMAWGNGGEIAGKGDASRQAAQVLENLLVALKSAGVLQGSIVKINVYVAQPDVLPVIREAMSRQPNQFDRVAMSFVTTKLPEPDALVAMDAIAVAAADTANHAVNRLRVPVWTFTQDAAAAVLPGGARYYISGQAKEGALVEATRNTLASLEKTLTFLNLDKTNVVQLKAFLQPVSAAKIVRDEIGKFFWPDLPPPTVFVEWKNSTNTPIEIELIAADNKPAATTGDSLEFLTPPRMTASKVFSRVAHVNHGRMIYFSGLFGNAPGPATRQINDIYVYLDYLLPRFGTDFDHLAKATYYVADQEASGKLDDIRPRFYNPQRPPAASKAMVAGVGIPDRSVTIDMIAVSR